MTRHRFALLLCMALAVPLGSSAGHAAPDASAQAPARPVSRLQDSPGWTPPADPESASVRLGRRVSAPLVKKTFAGGAKSMDELGRMICNVFERTPALDSLMLLTVSEDEFQEILWPEFPQSRPATGLTPEDGWRVLYPRLLNGCNSAIVEYGGGYWEYLRTEVTEVAEFRNFRLHQGVTIVVRNALGEEQPMVWLRAIAERKGRYKIYSVRD